MVTAVKLPASNTHVSEPDNAHALQAGVIGAPAQELVRLTAGGQLSTRPVRQVRTLFLRLRADPLLSALKAANFLCLLSLCLGLHYFGCSAMTRTRDHRHKDRCGSLPEIRHPHEEEGQASYPHSDRKRTR